MATTLVIGGMGVDAGIEFAQQLQGVDVIRLDVPHPCRVQYLNGTGINPAYSIANAIRSVGSPFTAWVMACNTAHAVYDDVCDLLPGGLAAMGVNMVENTIDAVGSLNPMWLGTTVLIHSTGIIRQGSIRLPNDVDQEIIQAAIWAAKVGQYSFSHEIARIVGDNVVVAGCTEMPAILRSAGIMHYVDPVSLL